MASWGFLIGFLTHFLVSVEPPQKALITDRERKDINERYTVPWFSLDDISRSVRHDNIHVSVTMDTTFMYHPYVDNLKFWRPVTLVATYYLDYKEPEYNLRQQYLLDGFAGGGQSINPQP